MVPLNLLGVRFSSSGWAYESICPTGYALEKKVLGRDGAGSGHSLLCPWVDVNSDSEYGSIKLFWQPLDFTTAPAYFPQAEHEFAREMVYPIPGSTLKSFPHYSLPDGG